MRKYCRLLPRKREIERQTKRERNEEEKKRIGARELKITSLREEFKNFKVKQQGESDKEKKEIGDRECVCVCVYEEETESYSSLLSI